MKITGIIILIIGLGLSFFSAVTFFTKEKIVDLGVIELTHNQPHSLHWSPFIGLAVMVVGVFLIILARRRK